MRNQTFLEVVPRLENPLSQENQLVIILATIGWKETKVLFLQYSSLTDLFGCCFDFVSHCFIGRKPRGSPCRPPILQSMELGDCHTRTIVFLSLSCPIYLTKGIQNKQTA